MSDTIAVLIPCYRSAVALPVLVNGIVAVLAHGPDPFRIVLVDDASPDDGATWRAIEALRAQHGSFIHGIRLARNAGQHGALLCAMGSMDRDVTIVVTMDDDGQHRPEDIPALLAAIRAGTDLAIGAYQEKRHGRFRNLGGQVVDWTLRRLFGLPSSFSLTSFRACRRFVVDQALEHDGRFAYLSADLLSATDRRANVPVSHQARRHGTSGYTLGRSLRLVLNLVFTHSRLPTGIMLAIAALSMAATIASLAYVVWLRLTTDGVIPGWASLMLMMGVQSTMLMSGMAMIMLYVTRSHRLLSGSRSKWRIADEI
ncbi:glycosyltransferase involved in cell wall biosynthesis [Bosea sp. OAE506]|uniref:glycosyltransferase n=1 Tax=Bosea sp. OAE506 TaxID=2663870 RepID=UPI00178BDD6C